MIIIICLKEKNLEIALIVFYVDVDIEVFNKKGKLYTCIHKSIK